MDASKKNGKSPSGQRWWQKAALIGLTALATGCDWHSTVHQDLRGRPYESYRTQETDPASPRDCCSSYKEQDGFAIYQFSELPNPILVEKRAENDLVVRIRRLQRDLNKEFDDTDMADMMNIMSASASCEMEEMIPDGMITYEDLGRPYAEHRRLAREYLE